MKAAADATALLSLEYMGVLNDVLGIADIYTTILVEEELKEISGFRDEKSQIAKKILAHMGNGKIKRIEIKGETRSKYAILSQCLTLCISGKIPFLLTDDAEAAYFVSKMASSKGIKLRMCAALLVELIRSGKIGRSSALEKLNALIDKRGWESGMLEVLGRNYLEEGDW